MGIQAFLRDILVTDFDPAASTLYDACVAAARRPVFYQLYGVPDSVDGRFDLLLLHVLLVIWRIKNAEARQKLFDRMFADMERSLREMGVGDMSIGKKMKPMLKGFYGRAAVYEQALAEPDDNALIVALSRNLYGMKEGQAAHAAAIASYVRAVVAMLAAQNEFDLEQGKVSLPAFA